MCTGSKSTYAYGHAQEVIRHISMCIGNNRAHGYAQEVTAHNILYWREQEVTLKPSVDRTVGVNTGSTAHMDMQRNTYVRMYVCSIRYGLKKN